MTKKTYKLGEIVAKLRQVDVLRSQGLSVADAIGYWPPALEAVTALHRRPSMH